MKGKTVITLTAIEQLYQEEKICKVLVIAPLRVARDTWPSEIAKWDHLKNLDYAVAVGTEAERKAAILKNATVTIINRENVDWLISRSGLPFDFDMVVIDELSSFKEMVYEPTGSKYKALSADVANKHGFNIHGVVFDELHTQPNRKLFDVMTKGSGDARMQPLYFLITTAGDNTNSICYEVHQKAKDIIAGRKIDPSFYPVIYGADDDDDWTDPAVWKKANPSLGITVGIDKVEAACEQAKQNPAEENSFRQLRLNQWVKQAVRWMPMDKWDKCSFAVNEDDLEGRVCYGGLDLSSTTDITAFVLVFPPEDEEDKFIILPYFWIPEDCLGLRVRRDHVPYDLWQKQGYLETTEGNVVHYGYIEKFIENLGERFNIREIAFDRWGAVQMVQNLEGIWITDRAIIRWLWWN